VYGQQQRGGALCSTSGHWSDRCGSPVRPLHTGHTFVGWTDERPPNIAQVGSRWGGAHRVVLGSAKPPRMPSIDVETKEEQQVIDWKSLRQGEKVKI
jgi:hypothetical protein